MGVQGVFTHLPFPTKCQHVLLYRCHCGAGVLTTSRCPALFDQEHGRPLCIFLDCFLRVFQHKILAATFNTIYENVTCLSIKGLYE